MITNKKLGLTITFDGKYYNVALTKRKLLFLSIGKDSPMDDAATIISGVTAWCPKQRRAAVTWITKTILEMKKTNDHRE